MSDLFLKELQKGYLHASENRYGEKVNHHDLVRFLDPSNSYYDELQRIKSLSAYRFKILVEKDSITLFEPLY